MNNDELNRLLKSVAPPPRDDEYWTAFPRKVTRHLQRHGQSRSLSSFPNRFPALAWGLSLAIACLIVGFAIFFWGGRDTAPEMAELASMRKYFHELRTLFPNQIRAIVIDDQGPHLDLAEQPNLPNAQPLFLSIYSANGCKKIITFSGQHVRVDGETCDVLISAEGNVMVVGDHWIWSNAPTMSVAGRYRIQAQPLEQVL